jgi:amino acid permease
MLIEVGRRLGLFNFSSITEHVFGPSAAKVLKLAIVAGMSGALMSYLNVIGSLGHSVVIQWGHGGSFLGSYSGFMLFVVALITPLTFFRSYGELTPISLLSLAFITILVFFALGEGLWLNDGQLYTAQAWPLSWSTPIQTLGTFAFGGSIQAVVFEAYLSVREEDKPKFINTTLALAVSCGFLLLTLMGVFGYGAFGSACDSDFMSSLNSQYAVVQVAQLIAVLHFRFLIPNAFIIMRLFACELFGYNPLTLKTPVFAGVTLSLWAFPVLVMAWIPKDDVDGLFAYIIDVTGDLPVGFSAFALPAALYIKVFGNLPIETGKAVLMHHASRVILVLGLILMVACPVADTYYFIMACITDTCSAY